MQLRNLFLSALAIGLCIVSCTKDKEDNFALTSYKDYLPMQAGDVQLYRMDSTVPTAFGAQFVVKNYLAKDSVTLQTLDATGDTVFFVDRFVTDTLQSQPWTLATTYQIVYTKNTVDLIQADGKRFIKLTTPVRDGYSWDGNQYFISADNSGSSDPDYAYYDWNYTYDSVGQSYTTQYASYAQTAIVREINSLPAFDPNNYNSGKFAQEVYANGVGLIEQNILYYNYQPPTSVGAGYDLSSFGIKLTRLQ